MQIFNDRFQADSRWNCFSAHYQEFSTVHSALVSFIQVFDYRFQADSKWNCFSAHHQEFSTVHSALVSFIQVFYDRFQASVHGNMNVKFVNAKQAKEIYQHRNTREKMYKTNTVGARFSAHV